MKNKKSTIILISIAVIIITLIIIYMFKSKEKITIILANGESINLEYGSNFLDPGYYIEKDGEKIVANAKVDISNVNFDEVGTYDVIYIYNAGTKEEVKKILKVKIVDTNKPAIILNGESSLTILQGTKYTEPGYLASDNYDGNISDKVNIIGEVNTDEVGTYEIIYEVIDSSNNKITTIREVKVVSKKTSSNITNNKETSNKEENAASVSLSLKGDKTVYLEYQHTYIEYGYTAKSGANDISDKVVITGNIDNNKFGEYILTYIVKDSSGNIASTNRKVIVRDTTVPEFINLPTYNIELNGQYDLLYGIQAKDNYSNVTIKVIDNGGFSNKVEGSYTITYKATDSSNNSNIGTRIVNVIKISITGIINGGFYKDNIIPIIDGASTIYLNGNLHDSASPIIDEGVYTLEAIVDNNVSKKIIFTIDKTDPEINGIVNNEYYKNDVIPIITDSNIDTITLNGNAYASGTEITDDGSYTLVATDKAGNEKTIVFIIDKTDPVINGIVNNEYYRDGVTAVITDTNIDTITLNGNAYSSGTEITADGSYTLVATDKAGNEKTIIFTIDKELPVFNSFTDLYLYQSQSIYNLLSGVTSTNKTNTTLSITNNNLDVNAVGDYLIEIKACDYIGNCSTTTRKIIVENIVNSISFDNITLDDWSLIDKSNTDHGKLQININAGREITEILDYTIITDTGKRIGQIPTDSFKNINLEVTYDDLINYSAIREDILNFNWNSGFDVDFTVEIITNGNTFLVPLKVNFLYQQINQSEIISISDLSVEEAETQKIEISGKAVRKTNGKLSLFTAKIYALNCNDECNPIEITPSEGNIANITTTYAGITNIFTTVPSLQKQNFILTINVDANFIKSRAESQVIYFELYSDDDLEGSPIHKGILKSCTVKEPPGPIQQ